MAGHVFLTHSDLTKINCDAWLLPSDAFFSVSKAWRLEEHVRTQIDRLRSNDAPRPSGWGDAGVRVLSLASPEEQQGRSHPYLVNVGGVSTTAIDWYNEGVRQFLQVVADQGASTGSRTQRAKPLVGLPLVGTGYGGASGVAGAVVHALVQLLHESVEIHDIDVVLVLKDELTFVAAQNVRRQYLRDRFGPEPTNSWPDLDAGLVGEATRLAEYATLGRLVLFIGAGVSRGANLPTWDELLQELARDAGMSVREQKALAKLHELDRPRIIQHRLAAQGFTIGQAVCDHLVSDGFSLAHSLLASLPATEVVTTNYDCLFEEASSAAHHEAAVLPYEPVAGHTRWLLKLHGSITHPADIVLTREDYLRYADRRAALGGIVQALLITRHMLFVGFSLKDDNFQRLVDDVRKAIRPSDAPTDSSWPFGSALLLRRDDLLEELWRKDLQLLTVGSSNVAGVDDSARQLDIFLDLLLAESSRGTSPLLDPAFDAVLSDEEREIRGLLGALEAQASNAARLSTAWRPIAELLHRLGGPAEANQSSDGPPPFRP